MDEYGNLQVDDTSEVGLEAIGIEGRAAELQSSVAISMYFRNYSNVDAPCVDAIR